MFLHHYDYYCYEIFLYLSWYYDFLSNFYDYWSPYCIHLYTWSNQQVIVAQHMCWFFKTSNSPMFLTINCFNFILDGFSFSSIYGPPYPTFQSHHLLQLSDVQETPEEGWGTYRPGVAVPPWATETVLSPWLAADEDRVSHVLSHVVWWKKNMVYHTRLFYLTMYYSFPMFKKYLKKVGGHIGRNVVNITIKMKTTVWKPHCFSFFLFFIYLFIYLFFVCLHTVLSNSNNF